MYARGGQVLYYAQYRYSYYIVVSCVYILHAYLYMYAVSTVRAHIYFLVPGINQDKNLRVCVCVMCVRGAPPVDICLKIRWELVRNLTLYVYTSIWSPLRAARSPFLCLYIPFFFIYKTCFYHDCYIQNLLDRGNPTGIYSVGEWLSSSYTRDITGKNML